jgi:hypothetical protein
MFYVVQTTWNKASMTPTGDFFKTKDTSNQANFSHNYSRSNGYIKKCKGKKEIEIPHSLLEVNNEKK